MNANCRYHVTLKICDILEDIKSRIICFYLRNEHVIIE